MNDDQLLRYSRQIMLPSIGIEGQEKLLKSRVLIVGLGGLGSPVAMYLAAAGVGELVLVDFDRVDITNLQRQIIHTTGSVGQLKVDSARQSLRAINPDCRIET
ncbi:MAG: ThiF family adenylyltransferase, partial [Sedimenticola sp.]|nr:ThiF family adenylyltransferase [Sedimenticola sp.]